MELDPEVLAYYDRGEEQGRLTDEPSLELVRTQVLLERYLPPAPARILDVGGGAGVYASWLAGLGHHVHLIDPVSLHVEQARAAGGFTAVVGDARHLPEADNAWDAVLLLGPLYHLVERADRVRALAEARRVCRPGGVVLAAAISRYASTFDGFFRGFVDSSSFASMMIEDLRSGEHRNPTGDPERFTTAYFHSSHELVEEVAEAGLTPGPVLPVEGMLLWAPDIERRLSDPDQRRLVLQVLAAMEDDPSNCAASAHLLVACTA